MKVKVLVLTVLMAIVPMVTMGQVPAELQQFIDEINSMLPMPAGNGLTLSYAGYDHSALVFTMEFDDDKDGIALDAMDKMILKKAMLENVQGNADVGISMLHNVLEAYDLDLIYAIHGRVSKKTIRVVLSLDEIRTAINSPSKPSSQTTLEQTLELMNAAMPIKIDHAMTMTRCVIEADTLFYIYEIDELFSSIEAIGVNLKANRSAILSSIHSNDAQSDFVNMCKQHGLAIGFRWVGKTSGKKVELVFPIGEY